MLLMMAQSQKFVFLTLFYIMEGGSESNILDICFNLIVRNSESTVFPSDGVITHLPVWGPGYEVSFEFYLNSNKGGYEYLFGLVGSDRSDGFGQPVIFYKDGKLPIWFALGGDTKGLKDGEYYAGDNLDIWHHPYGGSLTIDVNKWYQVSVASIKEDGKVC